MCLYKENIVFVLKRTFNHILEIVNAEYKACKILNHRKNYEVEVSAFKTLKK